MRIKQMIASLAIVCVLQPVNIPFSVGLPDSIYLQQQSSNSCTLAAVTMMIRSYLYQHEIVEWDLVTETSLAEQAWSQEGLLWQWQWSDGENEIAVEHSSLDGLTLEKLAQLLENHPEGILLYCGGDTHHGVLITGCTGQTVFCADPAVGYSGQEITLTDSLLGDRLGSQENILKNTTAYWYIASANDKILNSGSKV